MSETTSYYMQLFLPLIILFAVLWFLMIRPQRKKDNEIKKMRNSLSEGDEIITIGGMIGKVLSVKEDSVVVYVGSDKTKMEFKKWAISEVTKKNEKASDKPAEPVEEQQSEKKKIRKLTRKEDADTKSSEEDK